MSLESYDYYKLVWLQSIHFIWQFLNNTSLFLIAAFGGDYFVAFRLTALLKVKKV